jgi:DNA-binding FrmR family transcriptional regulator
MDEQRWVNIPYLGMVIQWEFRVMSHVAAEKAKLLNRVKRLRGQIEAIERAVEADDECADVLQQATSCRGALDGFIAEVIEDHIREHMVDPSAGRETPQALAAEELIEIVHQYLKK